MSFDFLMICLRDRAITAQSVEDYAAIGDMAHGAALLLAESDQRNAALLVAIRDEAREMEHFVFSHRF